MKDDDVMKIAGVGPFKVHMVDTPPKRYDEEGREVRKCFRCMSRFARVNPRGRTRLSLDERKVMGELGYLIETEYRCEGHWPSKRAMAKWASEMTEEEFVAKLEGIVIESHVWTREEISEEGKEWVNAKHQQERLVELRNWASEKGIDGCDEMSFEELNLLQFEEKKAQWALEDEEE